MHPAMGDVSVSPVSDVQKIAHQSHGNQFSKFYVMKREIFVGNCALAVPQHTKNGKNGMRGGGIPYRLIFLTNKIDFPASVVQGLEKWNIL